MKIIIRRILIFLAPIVLFFLFTLIYFYNYKLKVESEFENISRYECLIMGDSQMQRINPKLFRLNTYNFASTGEHFFFTFEKIKRLTKFRDHKIKNIILGVSPVSFAPHYNRMFSTKYLEGRLSLIRYLYFISLDDNEFLQNVDILSKSMIKAIYRKPDWGGLTASDCKNPDSLIIDAAFKQHFKIVLSENQYSSVQIKYLSKIDSICNVNDINLVLVSLPFHPLYMNKLDNFYRKILDQTVNSMNKEKYINYLDYKINPYLMSDESHLNTKGGDIFTKYLAIELENTNVQTQKNADTKVDPLEF